MIEFKPAFCHAGVRLNTVFDRCRYGLQVEVWPIVASLLNPPSVCGCLHKETVATVYKTSRREFGCHL
jgi:hypothetical protein